MNVHALTALFTNVRDVTALCERAGDITALARVVDHFAALRRAVEVEHGTFVKTIGVGTMAVFDSPVDAVRALLRAHELLGADMEGIQPVRLRAGAHHGPCVATTFDDRPDYFGATINIAARLARISEGGDIVISDDMYRDDAVLDVVRRLELMVMTEEVLLHNRTMRVHKLRPARVTWSRC